MTSSTGVGKVRLHNGPSQAGVGVVGAVQISEARDSLQRAYHPVTLEHQSCAAHRPNESSTCHSTHTSPLWNQLSPSTSPGSIDSASMVYDAADSYVVLFGGYTGSSYLSATWEFSGGQWTQLTPATAPPARSAAAMTYDAADGYVLMYGGYNGGYLGDTWMFVGGQWSQLSPTSSPGPLDSASMAYDAADGYVVLFGGYNGGSYLSGTWKFTAGQWVALSPSNSPSGRSAAAMAYDAADGYVVMFGGFNGGYFGDTWEYLGGQWTSVSPATPPGPRDSASMVYDSASGYVLMFGGYNGGSYLSDTWSFSGGQWGQQAPSGSPAARSAAGIAYDAADGFSVMFGGYDSNYLGDTWAFVTPLSAALSCTSTKLDLGEAATCTTGTNGGEKPFTYSYAGTGCSPSPTTSTFSCAPGAPGSYNIAVTVTDSLAQQATASAAYTVYADPTVNVAPSGPLRYDVGQSAGTLSATVTYAGPNSVSIEWYSSLSGGCGASSTNLGVSITSYGPPTTNAGTTYYCAVVFDSGVAGYQSTSNAVEVSVTADPTISVSPVGPLKYDIGQTPAQLTASVGYNGPNGVTVEWYKSLNLSCDAASAYTGTSGTYYSPSTSTAGTTNYCATVADSGVPGYSSVSNAVKVVVNGPLSIASFTATPSIAILGDTIQLNVTVAGGTAPYTYTYTGLPAGCSSQNASSLPCTPTSVCNCTVTVSVTDGAGDSASYKATFTVTSNTTQLMVSEFLVSPASISVGSLANFTVATIGGKGTLSYHYSGLPPGQCQALDASSFPCRPSSAGVFNVTVIVTDQAGHSASGNTTLTVTQVAGGPQIVSFTFYPSVVMVNSTSTASVTTTGGIGTFTYSYDGLPPGCVTMNESTFSCTPTLEGIYTVRVFVNDSVGHSATATARLSVESGFLTAVLSSNETQIIAGGAISLNVAISGGIGPYVVIWSVNGSNVSQAGTTWTFAITHPGTYTYVAWVRDSQNVIVRSNAVEVKVLPLSVSPAGQAFPWWLLGLILLIVVGFTVLLAGLLLRRRKDDESGFAPTPPPIESSPIPPKPPVGYMDGISVSPGDWDESAETARAYGTYTMGPAGTTLGSASMSGTAPELDPYRSFSLKITPEGVRVEETPRADVSPRIRDAEFSTPPGGRTEPSTSSLTGPSPADVYAVMQSLASKPRSLDGVKQEVHLSDDALFAVLGALSMAKLIARGTKKDSEATVFVLTPLGRKVARRFIGSQRERDTRRVAETSKRPQLPSGKNTGTYQAIRLEKGTTLQDIHPVGKERGSLEEETPFKTIRPEDVNPQLKGQKPLPKEVLQPMEMRVQSDRGIDSRDPGEKIDAEKRTQILIERAKKERREKSRFGVDQTDKPRDQGDK